mgnify:CR=1 FL=1
MTIGSTIPYLVKEQVKFNALRFTAKKLQIDIYRSKLGDERYEELADFRVGVEGVPSLLRRAYNVDRIPLRGLLRRGIWVHSKIMAFNFKSFFACFKKAVSPSFAT